MNELIYFLPDVEAKRLDATGIQKYLGDRFDGLSPTPFPCPDGPDGLSGTVLSVSGDGYYADQQEWHAFKRFHVGWQKGKQPGPADLIRPKPLRGMEIELADGNAWTIPVAVLQPGIRSLVDDKWGVVRDPALSSIWELAEEIKREVWEPINAVFEQHLETMAEASAMIAAEIQAQPEVAARMGTACIALATACAGIDPNHAVRILAINYRVGGEEVSALGLLKADVELSVTDDWKIIDTFVTGAEVREVRKKKELTSVPVG